MQELALSEENIEFVRRLWQAADREGIEGALELTQPDVEWTIHRAEGRVLSSAELLTFFREFQGERQLLDATPYSFEGHGDFVLASGSFRLRGSQGLTEFQIHLVYEFEDGRLVRVRSYADRTEALEALGLREQSRSVT